MKPDGIIIVDFGGIDCYIAGRKIREFGVYSEVVPNNISPKDLKALSRKFNIKGIILPDSPFSFNDGGAPECDSRIFNLNIPVLGISYGCCLLASIFNGRVEAGKKESMVTFAVIDKEADLLEGIGGRAKVFLDNHDDITYLPEEFELLAHADNCLIAAFKHKNKPIYALQWKPEDIHTENGEMVFKNFVLNVCRCKQSWRAAEIAANAVREIKHAVGDGKAIIALSGGIDSSTATALAERAIGRNLTAIFVDNGFNRENEMEFIRHTFEKFNINLILVDAKDRFFKKIYGIEDPEEKRKLIGAEFISIFEEVAGQIGAEYLIQGTIYPDIIESITRGHTEKIKTYHNVCGLPANIKYKIVEPLRDLYKDEVRRVAEFLGLPRTIVWKQPFPGPGLAIRITGKVTREKIQILGKADKILAEELEKSGVSVDLWQYFVVLTDTKTTGVRNSLRSYGYVAAIRAVVSKEALKATFARIPYDILENISLRITDEIPDIIRVVYDITHKPPSTIEWE